MSWPNRGVHFVFRVNVGIVFIFLVDVVVFSEFLIMGFAVWNMMSENLHVLQGIVGLVWFCAINGLIGCTLLQRTQKITSLFGS